jgi:hypothetical protein
VERDAQNDEVNQHENSKEALYPLCGESYRLFYTLPNGKCFIAFFARGATIFSQTLQHIMPNPSKAMLVEVFGKGIQYYF